MSSLRARCLEYIAKNGNHLPYQDVAAGMEENPQRVRGALNDASNEGFLIFGRDDVTGQGGYSLTPKGSARLKNGRLNISGKTADENKAACDAKESAAHVMSAPPVVIEPDDELPEPDASMLASANRVLSEQNELLRQQVAELEATEAKLRSELSKVCPTPIGFAHVWADGLVMFDTEEEARADIIEAFSHFESLGTVDPIPSHLCAIMETATHEITLKWRKS